MHSLPLSLAFFIALATDSLAAPQPAQPTPRTIPLVRRARPQRNATEWGKWASSQKAALEGKYSGGAIAKRASGMNLITNQNSDSSFYGSLAIGTPPVSYNVILDTGSADLWVAGTGSGVDSDIPTFDTSSSTSYTDLNTNFSITYGSGAASGSLGRDVVQMAGFEVDNQIFAVASDVSEGLLTSPVSGLMGLGFQTIAASGATPFWETLADTSGTLDDPLMAFQLTRYINDTTAQTEVPGGTFTLGAVNSSLYTGDIDYQSIPDGETGYWLLELSGLTAQGSSISLTSGSTSYAAIDTGTTLVGGPSDVIAEIFAQIPGSAAGTGNYDGYYTYPCSTDVNITLKFGSSSIEWPISNADFQLGQISSSQCLGAFFVVTTSTGTTTPSWIVGDTFLKNVYSVFRSSPASVGFAQLSSTALAMNGVTGAAPSATIGSVAAAVSATATASTGADRQSNAAGADRARVGAAGMWGLMGVAGLVALL